MRNKEELKAGIDSAVDELCTLVTEVREFGIATGKDINTVMLQLSITCDAKTVKNNVAVAYTMVDPTVRSVLSQIEGPV